MDFLEISKALSNETRVKILGWLKNPKENFPPQGGSLGSPVDLKGGVCVSSIQEKAGISASTISNYLSILQNAGLLLSERHGKWTYYRRNEEVIQQYAEYIKNHL
ncbi:MAG: helix-turn-helix transcriptional regulator [Desulfovibrionaceae bacterium]|nr:helix-turn-helix transcriptional regulator [Desulfovibrionaceae bacterium]